MGANPPLGAKRIRAGGFHPPCSPNRPSATARLPAPTNPTPGRPTPPWRTRSRPAAWVSR